MSQQPKTLQRCPCCAKATEIIVMGKCPKCASTRELMDEIARLTEENVQWDNLNKDVTSENVHLRHAINAGFETGKKLKADNERLTAQLQFSEICGEYVLEASELVVLRLVGDHFARKDAAPLSNDSLSEWERKYESVIEIVIKDAAPPAARTIENATPIGKSFHDALIIKKLKDEKPAATKPCDSCTAEDCPTCVTQTGYYNHYREKKPTIPANGDENE